MRVERFPQLPATWALVCIAGLAVGTPAKADLIGSTVTVAVAFQATPDDPVMGGSLGTAVVSATEVEFPCLTCLDPNLPAGSFDVGANYFEIDWRAAGVGETFAAHQNLGIISFDQEPALIITSAELDPSTTFLILPSEISFADNELFLDMSRGILYDPPTALLRINLSTATVPEPSTISLLVLAAAPLALARRWHR